MTRAWAVLLTAVVVSCSRPPPDATPDGALREWLDRMDAERSDPSTAPSAYALLSRGTQAELEKRAERSSRIEGHRVQPYEVLAPGRFAMRFEPRRFKTVVTGDTATVDVIGDGAGDVATMRCAREGKVWRVVLELPELAPLPRTEER